MYSLRQQQIENKMQSEKIELFCNISDAISESIDFFDESQGSNSPINHPAIASFRTNPRNHFYTENQREEQVSIDDDANSFNNPYAQFKCFKCYGLRNRSPIAYSLPLCQECDGSEFIAKTHPLATLFDKIIRTKLPTLAPRQPLNPPNSSRDSDSSRVDCRSCRQPSDKDDCYYCEICYDFAVCAGCFQLRRFSHTQGHKLSRRMLHLNYPRPRQSILTMKKISEVFEPEETCNVDDLWCSVCGEGLEECFQACATCEQEANCFRACSNCDEGNRVRHIEGHVLEVRTICKESKLPGLMGKPSTSESIGIVIDKPEEEYHHSPLRQNLKQTSRSIVYIPHIDLDDQAEMHEEMINLPSLCNSVELWPINIDNSSTETVYLEEGVGCNPESTEDVRTSSNMKAEAEEDKTDRTNAADAGDTHETACNKSMINIRMEQSQDPTNQLFSSLERKIQPLQLKGFCFNNTKNYLQVVSKPTDREKEEDYLFTNYQCDMCAVLPIRNKRYHCKQCENYDLCHTCYLTRLRQHEHKDFTQVDGKQLRKERELRCTKVRETSCRSSIGTKRPGLRNSTSIDFGQC